MGAIKGIGTDLVGIARLAEALDRSPSLARRLFTPAELSSGGDGGTSAPGSAAHAASPGAASLAARFAAKEAVIKAIGAAGQSAPPGSVPPPPPSWRYTEIEVVSSPGSPPRLALHGAVARHAAALGITAWHLSLSHDAEAALAFVVAE
ncbi:holo-ACP synthase [Actinomyces timonensis]|uniref:holo-ACP synthase n=1 Tax=Actinomyces timonensis TaxID=1288391 RepID=UPI00031BF1B6|nr:4'-phosphopantetheinyl transferase superfamily protein [Actinomyces timonensis]